MDLYSEEIEKNIRACDDKIVLYIFMSYTIQTLKQIVENVKMEEVNKFEKDNQLNKYKKMIKEKKYNDMLDGIRSKENYDGLKVLAAYNAFKEMSNNNKLRDYDKYFDDHMAIIAVITKKGLKSRELSEKYKDYLEEQDIYLNEFNDEEKIDKYGYQLLKIWRGQKEKAISLDYFLSSIYIDEIKKDIKEKYFGKSNDNEDLKKVFTLIYYSIVY